MPTTKRIASHRNNIQDLRFSVKYLRGDSDYMPCDYNSQHANPMLTDQLRKAAFLNPKY